MKVKFKKIHPDAVLPKYAMEGDAGMDMIAISRNYDAKSGYIEYETGVAMEIPEGYVGLVFPRSSISKYNMVLANGVGIIDSGYRNGVSFRFKPVIKDAMWKNLGKKIYTDLSKWNNIIDVVSAETFEDALLDEVKEQTPHGEYGGEEHTSFYKIHDKYYKATIHNIQWNRHDKQFYYIDMYDEANITFEELEEKDLPSLEPQNIYNVGDKIGQLVIMPFPHIEPEWTDELSETQRGIGSYGSTGN